MDPLSGIASVIAVVTAARETGIGIYKIVSGIRDGPKEVSGLLCAFEELNSVLREILSTMPPACPDEQVENLSGLQKTIDSCAKDIKIFERKLAGLNSKSGDGGLSKAWNGEDIDLQKRISRDARSCSALSHKSRNSTRCSSEVFHRSLSTLAILH
jgi:hypothetical protein